MSIRVGGVEIASVRVGTGSGNVKAKRVMLGTGTSAVEVWSARYKASGSGGPFTLQTFNVWGEVARHTVTGGGPTSGTFTVNWRKAWDSQFIQQGIVVQRNGVTVAIDGPRSGTNPHVLAIPEMVVAHGDTITFGAYGSVWTDLTDWSWTLA